MSDPKRGKYHHEYTEEFVEAKKRLSDEFHGEIKWGSKDYEAFTYRAHGLSLVFYPHKTSAGGYHIRVRDNGSKDKSRVEKAAHLLNTDHSCTFSMNNKPYRQ